VLHDDLLFRRADGTIVTKQQYLDAVPTRTYDVLEVELGQIEETETSAVVLVSVRAEGASNGKAFKGTYRNTRLFVREGGSWLCRVWVNVRAGLEIESIHHVSLPATDLERSKAFYREIVGLPEIERPPFTFPGAWFGVGPNQLHLIVGEGQTLRADKGVDSHDIHFAVRVRSFREALEFLGAKGYSTDAPGLMNIKVNEEGTAGFPQIYVLDPDRNVVEINAAKLD
jgi:glyoxylase I family protein